MNSVQRTGLGGISPEMERLCFCLKPSVDQVAASDDDRRWAAIDWSRFVALATHHHVIPLVVHALKAAQEKTGEISPHWLGYLQSRQRMITAYNLRAATILQQLQEKLNTAGIPSAPVKGPSLALLAYGDLSRRQFEDLDLLVCHSDLLRAVGVLEEVGYRLRELSPRTSRERYLKTLQGWSMEKEGYPPVDLKPVVASHVLSRPEDVQFMLEACRPLDLNNGRTWMAPGPEAMLLAVCMDGANEKWVKLSAVADVAALLATEGADWQGLLREARRMEQERTLLVGVQVAGSLLGVSLPVEFAAALRGDPFSTELALRAAAWSASEPSRHTSIFQQSRFGYQTRTGMKNRFRFYPGRIIIARPTDRPVRR